MLGFADEALIEVRSGNGGNGCVAFRREKYVPHGGPNGGDGGKGGDVIFCVKRNLRTLAKLRHQHCFKARNGGDGQGWNKFGADGEDCVIPVPPGTTIRDAETEEIIYDFSTATGDERFVFLKGGNGGWGNVHFKSSTNQAPRHANPGQRGETRFLRLELSIMADVGLVGFPNAGKSSLLTAFTNARPKIAPYPFTTIIPNLGVLRVDDESDIIIADIPGIIEGASEGVGLGDTFLKHISRTTCLIFMVDCSDDNYLSAYPTLCSELANYSDELMEKPRIVLCNKIDAEGAFERAVELAEKIRAEEPDVKVIPVSVLEGRGMKDARNQIIELVSKLDKTNEKEQEKAASFGGETKSSFFMASRAIPDNDDDVQYPGSDS
ncbi:MAG: GTPase ObgE [Treponema sp.]|nr:GTPase ObgE [Treponema sp.]